MADKQRSTGLLQPKDTKSLTSMEAYKSVMGAVFRCDPEAIEYLLWEKTAFPMCGIRSATIQLVAYFQGQNKGNDLQLNDLEADTKVNSKAQKQ